MALPVLKVDDEALHVLLAQQRGIVAAAGCVDLQEGAQLEAGPAQVVSGPLAAGPLGGAQHGRQMVPEEIAQPALGDAGQVEVTESLREADPEVLGFDEAGVAGRCGRVVDQPQRVAHLPHDHAGELHRFVGIRIHQ